jgi:hypothetical protein
MAQGNLLFLTPLEQLLLLQRSRSQRVVRDALRGTGEIALSSSCTSVKNIVFKIRHISGFRREVDENSVLLVFYAAYDNGSFLPTFRDTLSAPCSMVKPRPLEMGPIR